MMCISCFKTIADELSSLKCVSVLNRVNRVVWSFFDHISNVYSITFVNIFPMIHSDTLTNSLAYSLTHLFLIKMAEAVCTMVVPIRILIHTTVVPISILHRTTTNVLLSYAIAALTYMFLHYSPAPTPIPPPPSLFLRIYFLFDNFQRF